MKKSLLFCLLFSLNVFAADHTVEFLPGPGSVGNPEVSSITASKVSDLESAVDLMFPAGMVQAFALNNCPNGWVKADGSLVARTGEFARLFAAMGTIHGSGNGSTTFNLPDYRGRFLRGASESSILDEDKALRTAMASGGASGNSVGSVQGHAFQTHTHVQNSHNHSQNPHAHDVQTMQGNGYGSGGILGTPSTPSSGGPWTASSKAVSTTATNNSATAVNQNAGATGANSQASSNETRPVNAYVLYCVKK